MKYKKAIGESYIDKGSKQIVLKLKPTWKWILFGGWILIDKEDLESEAIHEYY